MGNMESTAERGRWKLVGDDELHFAWGSANTGVTGIIWFPPVAAKPTVSFDTVGGDRVLSDYNYFIGSMDEISYLVDSGSECIKMWFARGGCGQSTSDYVADAGHYCLHGQRP